MKNTISRASIVTLMALLLAPTFRVCAEENDSTVAQTPPLIPAGWNAALAADQVMNRLVRVYAPQVKGAHDAE